MTIEKIETKINITKEQINFWHVFLALPCYDSQLTEPFTMSLIKAMAYYKEIGLKVTICTLSDSLISRARNNLVAKFMGLETCTHLFFVDVDLAFDENALLRLLWHDKDIVSASYPIKEINWEKVKEGAKKDLDSKDLMDYSTRHVVHLAKPGQKEIKVENGALECYEAGTGFMLIKRQVFEKMFKKYKKLKYKDDTGCLHGKEKEYAYALFNSYVDDDGRFLSEDYGFCRYWQKMNGKIWVEPTIELVHLGRIKYQGNLANYLTQITQ
jgi:hypothetical protein